MNRRLLLPLLAFLALSLCASAQRRVRVACVGNSVTAGYGLADPARDSYPAQLQRMLGAGYEVRNFGHSGTTLLRRGHRPYSAQREFREAVDFAADLIVVHLGLNDTDPRNWPHFKEDFIGDYRALIDSLRSRNGGARVWVCLLSPVFHAHPRFESGTRDWHEQIRQHIRQLAETTPGVGLIDLYTPLHSRPDLFADALHPDAEGAGIIARQVYSALTGDYGGLRMPRLYGNGMVVQRGRPLEFHGTANAGERISVTLDGKRRKTVAKADGTWSVEFPKRGAGGPYALSVETSGGARRTIDSLWVGEVWLCSGQSNMEFTVGESATAPSDLREAAAQPLLHIYNMRATAQPFAVEWPDSVLRRVAALDYLDMPGWQTASAASVEGFSAIGYRLGRTLADSLGVPVGVICNAVGGTTCEAWIDRETLERDYPQILRRWLDNDLIMEWARTRARLNNARAANPLQRHPYEPAYMFECGIQPLERYALAGVAWYQGESNADRPEVHTRLFGLLQKSWRTYWDDKDLPFHFVQLSGLSRPSWPTFRDSQRRLAQVGRRTWMVVSHDLGDSLDVHFKDKRPVGERLAAQALRHQYGYRIESEGPTVERAECVGRAVELTFGHADGLSCTRGFEIAGADGLYHDAEVRVDTARRRIVLRSPQVSEPHAVRYAWQPFTRADLRNAQGFPASTFVIERLKGN
ncbi:MAG: sialate O-acetylesterase [Bacteroidaceae bacterium]|nr:sialate O-acetylesterase [Bacteroidaceae bacterium]